MDFNPYYIALLDVPKITPGKIKNLLRRFNNPEEIFRRKKEELLTVEGIDEEVATNIKNFNLDNCQEKIKIAEKTKTKTVSFLDEGYPKNLLDIKSFPPILFLKGEIRSEDELSLAIVGTRNPSHYGVVSAEYFARELAGCGVTIISGLAQGIDTTAHNAALAAKGRTIAVLGCGIDVEYPPENKGLRERIAEQGAVISEFNIKTPPDKFNFPRRNRIISGLAKGVLAVEAPEKSGVLITVWWATEQGRDVFVIPSPINTRTGKGTNRLLKEGAIPVTEVSDILTHLGWVREKEEKEVSLLTPEEKEVLEAISSAPLYVDEILERAKRPVPEILSLLLNMEIRGLVKQLPGNRYIKVYR